MLSLVLGFLAACGRTADREVAAAAMPASSSSAAAVAAAALPADSVTAGPYVVTAVGERDGEVLHVQRLVVRRAETTGVVQTLEGLATDTPWPPGAPGLQALDMNFDGHPDLRLIEFRAAGPNTPWRHWLFDPAAGQFVASPALDALSPTRFDAQHQHVVVDWRDGAARSGRDVYTWQDGQPRRESGSR